MAAETDLKWKLPGWRIESSYSNNVLIGNWDEERRKVSYWMINTLLMLMYQIKSRLGDIIPHCKCRDKHTKLFFLIYSFNVGTVTTTAHIAQTLRIMEISGQTRPFEEKA